MKSNTLNFLMKFLLFFVFFALFPNEPVNWKKAFVINSNGIVLFKSKSEKKVQIGAISTGQQVLYLEESDWIKIQVETLVGFLPKNSVQKFDFLVFEKSSEKIFAIIKKDKSLLWEKPISFATSVGTLNQFDLVEILSASNQNEKLGTELWLEVKTSDDRIGFIKDEVDFYNSLPNAKLAQEQRQLQEKGFFLVHNAKYFKEMGLEKIEIFGDSIGASKKGEFLFVLESKEIAGIRYYKTLMENPSRAYKMQATPESYNDTPFEAWISEKNGVYYSSEEFSRYTIEHTKNKKDIFLMKEILSNNKNLSLNFSSFSIESIKTNMTEKKSDFYLVKTLKGYTNSAGYGHTNQITFVVKERNQKFEVFSGNIENRGIIEMHDLDEDGTPEFYTHMNQFSMSRVAFTTPLFYGFVNGAYREIPLPGDFLDNYQIKNNILYLNLKTGLKSKSAGVKYKYKNGKFIQVK